MLRPRIIPCLLIHKNGLVKTLEFGQPKYVGDPINAIRVFNEKQADEIMVIDIDRTVNGLEPNFGLIEKFSAEARMPLCYTGGVTSVEQIKRIIGFGVEKVGLSHAALTNAGFVAEASAAVGSQSIAVVLDVKKVTSNKWQVFTHNGRRSFETPPVKIAKALCEQGAGELVIYSIDRDGTGLGYDLDLIDSLRSAVNVPITAIGGAGGLKDISALIARFPIIGAGAGDMFVFKGKFKAVLITYPSKEEKVDCYNLANSSEQTTQ